MHNAMPWTYIRLSWNGLALSRCLCAMLSFMGCVWPMWDTVHKHIFWCQAETAKETSPWPLGRRMIKKYFLGPRVPATWLGWQQEQEQMMLVSQGYSLVWKLMQNLWKPMGFHWLQGLSRWMQKWLCPLCSHANQAKWLGYKLKFQL